MTKKILITGSTGFIGSHLTEHLVKKGFNAIAFDRYNSKLKINEIYIMEAGVNP